MAFNHNTYENEVTCKKCNTNYIAEKYFIYREPAKNIEELVSYCKSCMTENRIPLVLKSLSRGTTDTPLPKADPTTGKIGRSVWSYLPTDFIQQLKEKQENESGEN